MCGARLFGNRSGPLPRARTASAIPACEYFCSARTHLVASLLTAVACLPCVAPSLPPPLPAPATAESERRSHGQRRADRLRAARARGARQRWSWVRLPHHRNGEKAFRKTACAWGAGAAARGRTRASVPCGAGIFSLSAPLRPDGWGGSRLRPPLRRPLVLHASLTGCLLRAWPLCLRARVRSSLCVSLSFSRQMMTIPGLPTRPAIYDIDLDTETGRIRGLF